MSTILVAGTDILHEYRETPHSGVRNGAVVHTLTACGEQRAALRWMIPSQA